MGTCSSHEEDQQQQTADRREARIGAMRSSGKQTHISDETTSTQVSAAFRDRNTISLTAVKLLKEKKKENNKRKEEIEQGPRGGAENPLLKSSLLSKSSASRLHADDENTTLVVAGSQKGSSRSTKNVVISAPVGHRGDNDDEREEEGSEMGDVELSSQVGKDSSSSVVGGNNSETSDDEETSSKPSRPSAHSTVRTQGGQFGALPGLRLDPSTTTTTTTTPFAPVPTTYLLPNGKRAKRISAWIENTRTFQELIFRAQMAKESRSYAMARLRRQKSRNASSGDLSVTFEASSTNAGSSTTAWGRTLPSSGQQQGRFAFRKGGTTSSSLVEERGATMIQDLEQEDFSRRDSHDRQHRHNSDAECDSINDSELSGCSSLSALSETE